MDNELVLTRQNPPQQRVIAHLARRLFKHSIAKRTSCRQKHASLLMCSSFLLRAGTHTNIFNPEHKT